MTLMLMAMIASRLREYIPARMCMCVCSGCSVRDVVVIGVRNRLNQLGFWASITRVRGLCYVEPNDVALFVKFSAGIGAACLYYEGFYGKTTLMKGLKN